MRREEEEGKTNSNNKISAANTHTHKSFVKDKNLAGCEDM